MRRNPLYSFKDRTSVGIYDVPLKSIIHVIDSDGQGMPVYVELISKEGLNHSSTVGVFLDNINLYLNVSSASKSQLEKLTEGPNTGWRLVDSPPLNYGDIGEGAIDFSFSSQPTDENGSVGNYSLAAGVNTKAVNEGSVSLGIGTVANNRAETAIGLFNASSMNNIFTVGVGSNPLSRKNAIEVGYDGVILAPELTPDKIINQQTLVTKAYVDNIDGGEF